jgi:hypothetical protein
MRALFGSCATGLLSVLVVATALAADHRDAPRISETPPADINDVYIFTAPGDSSRLVLVMTVNPLSDRDFAGSYAFSPRVLYRFAIDNTGGPAFERRIDITFSPPSAPGVQTFRARFPGGTVIDGDVTPPSTPNDPVIVEDVASGISIFAGPRDDPFFFDLVGLNRLRAGLTNPFRGIDSFAGFNLSAIVIELPADLLSDGGDEVAVSGFTLRKNAQTFTVVDRRLDRMGVPVVNTVFIPFGLKDEFNRSLPRNDENRFADEVQASLDAFGTPDDNAEFLAAAVIPDLLRLDLTQPDGFPNGRQLEDDVIDILLALIFPGGPTTDGVDANDRAFLESFPYLAPPFQPE